MHDMVGREDLQSAVRLSATSRQLGRARRARQLAALLMLAVRPRRRALFMNATDAMLPLAIWRDASRPTRAICANPTMRRCPGGRARLDGVVGTVRDASGRQIALYWRCSLVAGMHGASSSVNAFQAQMPEFAEDLGDPDGGHGYTALQMAGVARAPSSAGSRSNPAASSGPASPRPSCAQRCSR